MKKLESPPKPEHTIKDLIPDSVLSIVLGIYRKDEYLYCDKVKYKLPKDSEIKPEELWLNLKMFRKSKAQFLKFGKYNFHFVPDVLAKQLHFFDRNFGTEMPLQKGFQENKKSYLQYAILEESITSSQIEGAVTTRLKAREMLEKQQTPRNQSEQMILNNYATIQHIYEHKKEDLSPENLLEIHRLITAKTLENANEEGAFRQNDDIHIIDSIDGEIAHIPPKSIEIESFIADLCQFFNQEDENIFIHPIVKASIIHFMIGYFHPFTDGNGRTARALFYWYLVKNGYSLTEYLSISKVILASRSQYYKSFLYVENDENDLTYFIHYQVKTLRKAYQDLVDFIEEKQKEKESLFVFQTQTGINLRQAEILQWLQNEPHSNLTAKEVENRMQVSNQTAQTDLKGLVVLGYLQEIKINKKEKRYLKAT